MKPKYLIYILFTWLAFIAAHPDISNLILDYWYFFIVGLIGAVVANSTGSGGGIVFIPFFSTLDMTSTQGLATSILIQSFGMTAGAIGWLTSVKKGEHFSEQSMAFQKRILYACIPAAAFGVFIAQYASISPPLHMLHIFRFFSVVFGAGLLYITLNKHKHQHTRHRLNIDELLIAILISFIGGMLTAWISVGIGEFIALYLIIRHIPVMLAVSTAVCLSSATVLAAAPFHILSGNPIWEIVLFAAPAAIAGGTVAKYLAFKLGPVRLKVFFATWILATGLSM